MILKETNAVYGDLAYVEVRYYTEDDTLLRGDRALTANEVSLFRKAKLTRKGMYAGVNQNHHILICEDLKDINRVNVIAAQVCYISKLDEQPRFDLDGMAKESSLGGKEEQLALELLRRRML